MQNRLGKSKVLFELSFCSVHVSPNIGLIVPRPISSSITVSIKFLYSFFWLWPKCGLVWTASVEPQILSSSQLTIDAARCANSGLGQLYVKLASKLLQKKDPISSRNQTLWKRLRNFEIHVPKHRNNHWSLTPVNAALSRYFQLRVELCWDNMKGVIEAMRRVLIRSPYWLTSSAPTIFLNGHRHWSL